MIPSTSDWHISLHFLSDGDRPSKIIDYRDRSVAVIELSPQELQQSFPAKFDVFIARANSLPEGYAEGDGSFGFVGPDGSWKICGTIYEHQDAIQYAELMGQCPGQSLIEIADMLGVPPENCAVQTMQGGFFQSLAQFLKQNAIGSIGRSS